MVEESVTKATEAFVFEPNDANTWIRIKVMIENYLTTLWQQGALQGSKPNMLLCCCRSWENNDCMDIIEGRLIVEIGMAVVRPAEFIILRYSIKMATS